MYTIRAVCPDHALDQGIHLLKDQGREVDSRNGMTLELPEPCTTTWLYPIDRVSFDPARDANPFFHLFESLWILAGRRDVRFLEIFNKRMRQYSEDGLSFHAPYGYRIAGQIPKVIELLYHNPESRRAVLQIWDHTKDLGVNSLDIPCNDLIFFKIRQNKLQMTISCRSNDMLWGAYGANVVQFSMIQEYIATALGIEVGFMHQVSDSLHAYIDGPGGELWNRLLDRGVSDWGKYLEVLPMPLVDENGDETIDTFNQDLVRFFDKFDALVLDDALNGRRTNVRQLWGISQIRFQTQFFENVVRPMLDSWLAHKSNMTLGALINIKSKLGRESQDNDWLTAGHNWLDRRYSK